MLLEKNCGSFLSFFEYLFAKQMEENYHSCMLYFCFYFYNVISMLFFNVQQSEIYDRIDQAALLRQEQLLKAQSLQAASLDGGARYFILFLKECTFSYVCVVLFCQS